VIRSIAGINSFITVSTNRLFPTEILFIAARAKLHDSESEHRARRFKRGATGMSFAWLIPASV